MVDPQAPNEFDVAAEQAEKQLFSILDDLPDAEKKGAMTVINWQANNYMKAGHKRLGRILVKIAKGS